MAFVGSSKDFDKKYAVKNAVGLTPSAGELYGGATYPTLGANDLIRLDEADIIDNPEQFDDVSSTGNMIKRGTEVSAVLPTFSLKSKFYSLGIEPILIAAMGYEDLDGPLNYSTTEYSHLFDIDPEGKDQRAYDTTEAADATANVALSPAYNAGDRLNRYFTLGIEKGPYDEQLHNCAISEFTISAESKGPVMLEASGTGEIVVRNTSKTTVDSWTELSGAFDQWFALRHCSATFGPLASEIAVSIFSYSIKTTYGMAEDLVTSGTSNSGLSRAEPVSTGEIECEVTFQINKHDTINYKTYEQAGTVCSLTLDHTRGTDRLILLFPHLVIQSATEEISDGSKINVVAKGYLPTGVDPYTTERSLSGTEHTKAKTTPFYFILSNQRSDNGLRLQ